MPDRPLLPLPAPSAVALPGRKFPIGQPRFPSAARQRGRLGPKFTRLRDLLSRPDGVIELREDPSSLAPDRVIVFEIAGSVANFLKAISRIQGLEFSTRTIFPQMKISPSSMTEKVRGARTERIKTFRPFSTSRCRTCMH
jgi:hypothetical protein